MIRLAAVQAQMIGKTHLMMEKIQNQIDHDRNHREENGNVTVQDQLEVDRDLALDRPVGIMVLVIRAMADIKAKIGVEVAVDEVDADENHFGTLNRAHHFAVAVTGAQTILLMVGTFFLVGNHPKHIPIVQEALQRQVHRGAVPRNIIKIPLTTALNQNHGQKHP